MRSRTSQNVQRIARLGEQNAIAFWNLAGAAKPLYNGVRNNGQSRTPVPTGWCVAASCADALNKRAITDRPYKKRASPHYAAIRQQKPLTPGEVAAKPTERVSPRSTMREGLCVAASHAFSPQKITIFPTFYPPKPLELKNPLARGSDL